MDGEHLHVGLWACFGMRMAERRARRHISAITDSGRGRDPGHLRVLDLRMQKYQRPISHIFPQIDQNFSRKLIGIISLRSNPNYV